MMKFVLDTAALTALLAAGTANAQPPLTSDAAEVRDATGVLADVTVNAASDGLPEALPTTTEVTVDTTVAETPTATVETTTEVITEVSDRPELNAENPIAPEVQAVIDSKANYTTADLANAQLAAVLATPPSSPTTVITTTRTTLKEGS